MKEVYRVTYHILLFVVVEVDYVSIEFQFYDNLYNSVFFLVSDLYPI